MNRWLATLAPLCIAIAAPAVAQNAADEAALRRIAQSFGEAWGRHDARALTASMSEAAIFVTAGGRRLEGRGNIENYHARLFRGSASQSTNATLNVTLRFLRPDVALVERWWQIDKDRYSDRSPRPQRTGLMTMVAERRNGGWLVTSVQSINVSAPGRAVERCACPATGAE